MKAKEPWGPEQEVFISPTDDPAHQFVIQAYDWGAEPGFDGPIEEKTSLFAYVHLNPLGIFSRLKHGLLYIFGRRSKFGDFAAMEFRNEDVDRLILALIGYKKKLARYQSVPEQTAPVEGAKIIQVPLEHLPARYGVKFLWGNIASAGGPLGTIFYSYNGDVQKEGVRIDMGKRIFLDKFINSQANAVAEAFKGEIIKAMALTGQKGKNAQDKGERTGSDATPEPSQGDKPATA